MPHLPLVLNLKGVSCLVVGAGGIAARRISSLVRAGARVKVVAPTARGRIRDQARRGTIEWRRSGFRPTDLRGVMLVVAATSDTAVNRKVARAAHLRGCLVNVIDAPPLCSVIFPAVLKRGSLLMAVTTLGESPTLSRALRDELAVKYGREYPAYVKLIGAVRRRLRRVVADSAERERRTRRVLDAPVLSLLRSGHPDRAREAAMRAAGLS